MEDLENKTKGNINRRYLGASGLTSFIITVTADKMEAYIQLFGSGINLTMEEVVSAIKDIGITRGVSRKIIEGILEGKHGKRPILFAKGLSRQTGKDGWFEFFFRRNLEKKPTVLEDGSVDYQNVEWFEVVEEGQLLVEYHPAQEGIPGMTIFGQKLPAKKGKDLGRIGGTGFTVSEDNRCYYANTGGRIEFENNKIEILRLFIIDEITLATGNLEFDGSVLVRGNIGSGTSLKATEDIVIDGFVESAQVESGGSIMFRQGMNASGEGSVKAKEYVAGKFFEAVNVECDGEIQADYFLNCTLFAREQIIVSGKMGSIAGGTAYAMEGFITRNVGNRVGLKTYLRVGLNEDILREQLEIENIIKAATLDVNKLTAARNEMEIQLGRDECLASEKYNKIAQALEQKEKILDEACEKSEKMVRFVDKLRKAQIVINNMLYEGVTCEINNQKIQSRDLKNVTVKPVGNRIGIFENY